MSKLDTSATLQVVAPPPEPRPERKKPGGDKPAFGGRAPPPRAKTAAERTDVQADRILKAHIEAEEAEKRAAQERAAASASIAQQQARERLRARKEALRQAEEEVEVDQEEDDANAEERERERERARREALERVRVRKKAAERACLEEEATQHVEGEGEERKREAARGVRGVTMEMVQNCGGNAAWPQRGRGVAAMWLRCT